MLHCDSCGDTVIGDEGNKRIDAWLDKETRAITPEEIQTFLTKYHLTQKEASLITGLGEKNIGRWLSGKARPSESVSNFLRLLAANESNFELLKQRNFSSDAPSTNYPSEECSPSIEEKLVLKQIDFPKLVQLRVVNKTLSPKKKRTQLCQLIKCENLIELREKMEDRMRDIAAFKDTGQKANLVSGGLWVSLGEDAARNIETNTYSREKLRETVKRLRKLTTRPLSETASNIQSELAQAGVALVFIPIMKESALRGCTRLLTEKKALIIHGLKFRNVSQFWIILFHEIAHLLLHISKPGQAFPDYEKQKVDPQETQADEWAHDTLVSRDKELEFLANNPKPNSLDLKKYADEIQIHPAIAAEILNKRSGNNVFHFGQLRNNGLFPVFSEIETDALMATSSFSTPANRTF